MFAGVIGVSSSAVWVEAFRPEIETALAEVFGDEATEVIWRRSDGRLQQDGWKGNDRTAAAAAAEAGAGGDPRSAEAAAAADAGRGSPGGGSEEARESGGGEGEERRRRSDAPATVVRELGLDYLVRPQFGQKTGVPRRREGRVFVWCRKAGKRVSTALWGYFCHTLLSRVCASPLLYTYFVLFTYVRLLSFRAVVCCAYSTGKITALWRMHRPLTLSLPSSSASPSLLLWRSLSALGAGFYCDQRESRAAVRELSAGKNVLDM